MYEKADFLTDWQSLAQQSWDAWLDFARRSGAPVNESLDNSAAVERMLEGMRGYFGWLQRAGVTPPPSQGPDWQGQFRQFIEQAGEPFRKMFGKLEVPGSEMFEQQMKRWFGALQEPMSELHDWLKLPTFGYSREHQQLQQRMLGAMADYGEQLQRYHAMMADANLKGLELLEQRLAEQHRSRTPDPVHCARSMICGWMPPRMPTPRSP